MKRLLLCLILFLSQGVFAASFFCAHTNTYVNTGDSMSAVKKACGNPSVEKLEDKPQKVAIFVKQWFFSTKERPPGPFSADEPGILVSFTDEQAFEILVNGNAKSRALCPYNQVIQLGMTRDQIRTACGKPDLQGQSLRYVPIKKQSLTTWTYDVGPYRPKINFIFEDGILSKIQQ